MYLFRMKMHHSNAMRHFYGMRMTDYATTQTNQPNFSLTLYKQTMIHFINWKKGSPYGIIVIDTKN